MKKHDLDPREWEFYIDGLADNPRTSCTGREAPARLTDDSFPRIVAVRLVKKIHNRPCTMITISIIDFLQTWTCKKKLAQCLKIAEPNKATVPPDVYGSRFAKHFKKCFVTGPGLEEEPGCPETPAVVKPANHRWWHMPTSDPVPE